MSGCRFRARTPLFRNGFRPCRFLDAPSKRGLYCGMAHLLAALTLPAVLAISARAARPADTAAAERTSHPRGLRQRRRQQRQARHGAHGRRLRRARRQRRARGAQRGPRDRTADDCRHGGRQPGGDAARSSSSATASAAFFKKLDGKAQIALSTYGERPTPLVEYTDSTAQLQKGVGRLFARSGAGAYLLEALVELSRGIEKREAKRPVIVVVAVESESRVQQSLLHEGARRVEAKRRDAACARDRLACAIEHRRDAQPQHDHRRGHIADGRPARSGPGRERARRPPGAARRRADEPVRRHLLAARNS